MIWGVRPSLSELGQGGDNGVDTVVGVSEWWTVSAAPRELSRNSNDGRVLNKILWCQVTNLLLAGVVHLNFWNKLSHLLKTELGGIADVVQGLDCIQVEQVVSQPQLVVVLHRGVQLLHQLGSETTLRDGAIDLVLGLHELIILCLDLGNDVWGVNGLLV